MNKMVIEVNEEALISGKYDGLGKISVDIAYIKDLNSTCLKLANEKAVLTHNLDVITKERNKLLEALGGGENDNGTMVVIIDSGCHADAFNFTRL